jgi:hypothetical protein
MTMALPPEFIDRHLGMGQSDHRTGSLDFQVNLALFGRPTVSWLSPRPVTTSPVVRDRIVRMLDTYRTHLQSRGQATRIHHHTPVEDGDWGVLERASLDGEVSIVGAFRLARTDDADLRAVRPRGVDPARSYTVEIDGRAAGTPVSGHTLATEGIVFRLDGALTSSVAVLVAVGAGTDAE